MNRSQEETTDRDLPTKAHGIVSEACRQRTPASTARASVVRGGVSAPHGRPRGDRPFDRVEPIYKAPFLSRRYRLPSCSVLAIRIPFAQ